MYSVPYVVINLGFWKKKFGLFYIFTLASTGKESFMRKQLKRCQFYYDYYYDYYDYYYYCYYYYYLILILQ